MDDDRRATIEAAMDSVGSGEAPTVEVKEPVQEELNLETPETPETPDPAAEVAQVAKELGVETVADATARAVEAAPQSWKAGAKAKWNKIDPEIRQEVMRREKQTTQVLNESAQARQVVSQFQETIQPYMARINSVGHPLAAVKNLLHADHLLSTSPPQQRAQIMAKMINDYGIDLQALDNVLAGNIKPVDPVESRVEQLLQQRLAPYQQLLAQQQQNEQQATQQLATTVQQMAQDPKYPYFEKVRQDMADIIELSARKNVPISIEQAYNRAIQLDPEINKLSAAAKANTLAQRAKKASSSVGGAPSGLLSGSSTAGDRRATIEAAFDAIGGR